MNRDLLTVRQLAENSPAFSEASLRNLIFNRKENGFDSVVVRVGGRVLIDLLQFNAYLEGGREGSPIVDREVN